MSIKRVIRLAYLYPRADASASIMSHRFQIQSRLVVIVNLRAKPAKKRSNVSRIEMLAVNLKIFFLVGHPDTPTKPMLVAMHWNLNNSTHKEVVSFNDAKAFC